MNRLWQARCWLALLVAGQFFVRPLPAQNLPDPGASTNSISVRTDGPPRPPLEKSPVDSFRQLLAMMPDEREACLTNRPPEIRARIIAKIDEYMALDPNERELRLRATDLRWYLIPLLRESPTNRAARLAQIPVEMRELVQYRLDEWIILPPTLKEEFLENEHILGYFAQVDAGSRPAENFGQAPSEAERAHWNGLSEPERRQVAVGFKQFFELTPDEKEKALNTLSEPERVQMQKTLHSFENLTAVQRGECVNAFAKFASMSPREKAMFLKNAERWSAMSPAERQAWRDLVVNVPQWPPLPDGFVVPIPGESKPGMATNRN
jgi:hypothetical protein